MDQQRQETLLRMHQFYTQEARHQRSMMWETVKWFTPVLTAICGFWLYTLISNMKSLSGSITIILFCVAVVGAFLSCFAMRLLGSFYKTNLIYITMFVKIEDELEFVGYKRRLKYSYSEDDFLTYEAYRLDRAHSFRSAEDFVTTVAPSAERLIWIKIIQYLKLFRRNQRQQSQGPRQPGTMYCWMTSVFYLFYFAFIISAFSILIIAYMKNI